MKQAGYPPQTNHPSSARYNPYKVVTNQMPYVNQPRQEMGYYGYTYGGPPTGSHLRYTPSCLPSPLQRQAEQLPASGRPGPAGPGGGDWPGQLLRHNTVGRLEPVLHRLWHWDNVSYHTTRSLSS